MGHLAMSTAIMAVCAFLAFETLSFVRAERLAQRRRSMVKGTAKDVAPHAAPWLGARTSSQAPLAAGEDQCARSRVVSALFASAENRRDTAFGRRLQAAGIGFAPAWWIASVAACAVLSGTVAWTMSGIPAVGGIAAAVAPLAAFVFVRRRTRKRRELFDAQIARALPQIAASVRGSLTLERALRVALVHMEDPLKDEFARVLADASYGMPLHEALEAMARRTQSVDVKTLAAATRIRQGTGGSVGSALALISTRVNARLKEERELRVEIASTRMAKWFVAAAMPAIFLLMYATNADFARFYEQEPLGWAVLGVAVVLEVTGLALAHAVTSLDRC